MPSFKDTTAPIPPSRKETKFQGSRFGPARQLVHQESPRKAFPCGAVNLPCIPARPDLRLATAR